MSKIIAIVHGSKTIEEFFLKDHSYKDSYMRLAQFAEARNIDLRFVLGVEQYENGVFKSYWKYENENYTYIPKSFVADLVYLKERSRKFEGMKRVNSIFLEEICRDKILTASVFPQFVKKTILLTAENISDLDKLRTEVVVLKPRSGTGGKNVQVLDKQQITAQMLANDEFVVQELIESSSGIPNLIEQRHELRLYVMNGEIQSAYIRLPATGSYLSNISQGATVQLITTDQIPQSARKIASEVDTKFTETFPRVYTVDLMYEKDQAWIVELNDQPGLPDVSVQPLTDNYLHVLLDLFVSGLT